MFLKSTLVVLLAILAVSLAVTPINPSVKLSNSCTQRCAESRAGQFSRSRKSCIAACNRVFGTVKLVSQKAGTSGSITKAIQAIKKFKPLSKQLKKQYLVISSAVLDYKESKKPQKEYLTTSSAVLSLQHENKKTNPSVAPKEKIQETPKEEEQPTEQTPKKFGQSFLERVKAFFDKLFGKSN